jgi:hypothetical protein
MITVFLMKKLKANVCYLTDHKMKKLVFFFGIMLISCTSNSIYEKPKDLIPKDTMIALLTDIYIANAAYLKKNIHLERKVNYSPFIYNKYKIDSLRFSLSNFYYVSKIDTYNEIYKEVKNRLTAQKKELEKALEKEPDSLRKGIDQEFRIEEKQ